jgi:titin
MDALSETESEPEQFPTEPVVEDTSLEKPKRVYKKKVKVVEPAEPAEPAKPKRVMTEEHKEKMRLAREASKARKALTKPEPITQETEVLPELKKRGRPKKVKEDKVVEPKAEPKENVIVKEIHHHYAEPKKEKVKKEKAQKEAAPRKPRQPKVESKPKTVVVDFV